jgi:hypothetical protein
VSGRPFPFCIGFLSPDLHSDLLNVLVSLSSVFERPDGRVLYVAQFNPLKPDGNYTYHII